MLSLSFVVEFDTAQVRIQQHSEDASSKASAISVACGQGFTGIVQGRIFRGPDLCRSSMMRSDASTDSAAEWVVDAYLALGSEGLAQLEGDFSFVLIDWLRRRVLAGRDPHGGYPLFWAKTADGFAISSSLHPLTRTISSTELNWEFVADFLTLPNAGVAETSREACVFAGCHRVLGGQILMFDFHQTVPRLLQTWDWERFVGSHNGATTIEDAIPRIQQSLQAAVDCRMTGTVGAHFSGGMDSTGVALLGARTLERRGDSLHAFAKVYPSLRHLSKEKPYIERAARYASNLRLTILPQQPSTHYAGLDNLPLFDEPHPGLACAHQAFATSRQIAEHGLNVLMTGVGGDHVFDASLKTLLAMLLKQGRLQQALSRAEDAGRRLDYSRWTLLRTALGGFVPDRLQSGLGAWFRGGRASWLKLTDQTVAPWMVARFAKQYELFDRAMAYLPHRLQSLGDAANNQCIGLIRHQAGDINRWYGALPHGMSITHPFFDLRLIREVLSIPAAIRCQPGRQKHLLAEALRGVLPDEILDRRRKGHFGELTSFGFTRHQNELMDLIVRSDVPSEVVNKHVLSDCLRMAACGVFRDMCGIDRLNLTLSFLHWLTCLPSWRSQTACTRTLLSRTWDSPAMSQDQAATAGVANVA